MALYIVFIDITAYRMAFDFFPLCTGMVEILSLHFKMHQMQFSLILNLYFIYNDRLLKG
jgi:hypothetical protein